MEQRSMRRPRLNAITMVSAGALAVVLNVLPTTNAIADAIQRSDPGMSRVALGPNGAPRGGDKCGWDKGSYYCRGPHGPAVVVTGPETDLYAGQTVRLTVNCPVGTTAVGGGVDQDDIPNSFVYASYPDAGATSWTVALKNISTGSGNDTLTPYAVCLPLSW